MEILHDQKHRLDECLSNENLHQSVKRPLPTQERIESGPGRIIDRKVQQSQEGRHQELLGLDEAQDLVPQAFTESARVIVSLYSVIAAQEVDRRQRRARLAI